MTAGRKLAPQPFTIGSNRFSSLEVTPVFDAYWQFAAERQEIYFRRIEGRLGPWTDDPILKQFRFTNAYRAADRVSQYLIRSVIYEPNLDQNPDEVFFRTILFKIFNKIETWEVLTEQLGVGTLKISSGDIDNFELLEAAGESECDVILSTGLSTLVTIRKALEYVPDATLLHCTSAYPAPIHDANLRAMDTMRKEFGRKVGLSDHTPGWVVPVAAAARGAEVIEKHITLSRDLPGPDHKASLEPEEFKRMVTAIRDTEAALGDGVKTPRASEADVMRIVAARRAFRCAS